MRIAVLGTGALGCLFAARLAACAEVWMLGTWEEAIAAVRRGGICVDAEDGTWRARVQAIGDPTAMPKADVVLVLVKSYQTDRAARWASICLAPDGLVVTLQNGLHNGARLAEVLGTDRCAPGITFEGATLLQPGHVRHAGHGPTLFGPSPATLERTQALIDLLQQAGFEAGITPDIEAALWGKTLINAAINPLTALWRMPNGELLASKNRRLLLADLVAEATAVAQAKGVVLPFPSAIERVEAVCRATAANHSSMLQDIEHGRPTEIDAINGAIVAEGKRLGIPTPINETIWRLVRNYTER